MAATGFRFGDFHLDPANRQLTRDGAPVEVNARYLDALILLVREPGQLISKDRFMAEIWRGVPVTDEALTQCIRTLRRQLGDDAASPRFIETVPKHGYRFIAAVEGVEGVEAVEAIATPAPLPALPGRWDEAALTAGFAILGGAVAGLIGGMIYGFVAASQPSQSGAASALLVLLSVTTLLATIGATGVGIGIAVANALSARPWRWSLAGGAAGGLIVGALGKMLGLDAFSLLLGQSPGNITGGLEGALLGGGVGLGCWLAHRSGPPRLRRAAILGGLTGGTAGLLAVLLGGRLLAGSLALLGEQFPASCLRIDQIGSLPGDTGFGPLAQALSATLEGTLFGACTVGAIALARRERRA
jgi:DNA-binding winged helix-turn-helix (wHTH) protein